MFLSRALAAGLLVATAAQPHVSTHRGAVTLTFVHSAPDSNGQTGGTLTYAVVGRPAAVIVIPSTAMTGDLEDSSQLRLVPLVSEALPLAILDPITEGRDTSEYPIFIHRAPATPSLTLMQKLIVNPAGHDPVRERWHVQHALLAYTWTYESAIPIRGVERYRYWYVTRTDGLHEIVVDSADVPRDENTGNITGPPTYVAPPSGCYETRGEPPSPYVTRCAR